MGLPQPVLQPPRVTNVIPPYVFGDEDFVVMEELMKDHSYGYHQINTMNQHLAIKEGDK